MLFPRVLLASTLVGLLASNSCFQSPEDRDFGILPVGDGGPAGSGGSAGSVMGVSGGGSGGSGGVVPTAGAAGTLPEADVPDGSPCFADANCDDGSPCNGPERCVDGYCEPGTLPPNGTSCTVRHPVFTPPPDPTQDAGAPASSDAGSTDAGVTDGGADATAPDASSGGAGGGASVPPGDASVGPVDFPGRCFDGGCHETCTSATQCNDYNPCTGLEACDGARGVCVQGVATNCDDANDCTDDRCDPEGGDPALNYCINLLSDADGDGHPSDALGACGDDCNDDNPEIYLDAPELCDGLDNDCSGAPETPGELPFWFIDCDGDGYSASNTGSLQQCDEPAPAGICGGAGGWTLVAPVSITTQDCNDANAVISPGATEVCDGDDDDCSGVDDDVAPKRWPDCDGDSSAASGAVPAFACVTDQGSPVSCPGGYWTTTEPTPAKTDCNDGNNAIGPGFFEDCANPDGIDNSCDGVADQYVWYADCDSDAYPAEDAETVSSCDFPASSATTCGAATWTRTFPFGDAIDCDDGNARVYPRQYLGFGEEDPTWGWDYDCDGEITKGTTATSIQPSEPCVSSGLVFCSGVDGWTGGAAPECGETAPLSQCQCDRADCGQFVCIGCSSCTRRVVDDWVQTCH